MLLLRIWLRLLRLLRKGYKWRIDVFMVMDDFFLSVSVLLIAALYFFMGFVVARSGFFSSRRSGVKVVFKGFGKGKDLPSFDDVDLVPPVPPVCLKSNSFKVGGSSFEEI